jgi:hypothetical protein
VSPLSWLWIYFSVLRFLHSVLYHDVLNLTLHISCVRNSTCRLLQLSQVKHLKETSIHQIGTRKRYVQTPKSDSAPRICYLSWMVTTIISVCNSLLFFWTRLPSSGWHPLILPISKGRFLGRSMCSIQLTTLTLWNYSVAVLREQNDFLCMNMKRGGLCINVWVVSSPIWHSLSVTYGSFSYMNW